MNHLTPHVYWLSPNRATGRPLIGAVVGGEAALLAVGARLGDPLDEEQIEIVDAFLAGMNKMT